MEKSEGLIIIPAFNEEKNIKQVIKGILECKYDLDILVINDGSKDCTGLLARKTGVNVIDHFYNMGYGGALQTGFKYAVSCGYQYVVQFDGDGQHEPKDILLILEILKKDCFDIVLGSRFINYRNKVSLIKVVAIKFFRYLISFLTGVKITDPTSGIQGLNRKVFSYYARMGNFPEDFPDADTIIHMIMNDYRIVEVPVTITQRISGKSMHHGFKSFYYVIKMIVSISVVVLKQKTRNKKAI
ncbi:MAG: glycosyltransferase family 2 protein [Eubacteriales bacterium]